jgi:DNA polymerase-3 subunit epsilon
MSPLVPATPAPALVERAERLLSNGPLASSRLVELVCNMPGVPPAVADEITVALLGSIPGFRRDHDGTWSLNSEGPAPALLVTNPTASLDSLRFLVVDVETTGLSHRPGGRITEIAAYALEGGAITQLFNTLVNPGRPIPPYITALTGISGDMVRNAPHFGAHSDVVLSALAGRVFVGHNVAFDWGFVSSELLRATGMAPRAPLLCTVKLARALLPGLPRRSLDHVAFHLGVDIESRHRAAGDALATARVLAKLLRVASQSGVGTWGELDQMLRLRGRRTSRPRRRGRVNKRARP